MEKKARSNAINKAQNYRHTKGTFIRKSAGDMNIEDITEKADIRLLALTFLVLASVPRRLGCGFVR